MREPQTPRSDAPDTGHAERDSTSKDVPEEMAGKSGVQKVETEWLLPTEEKWVRVSFVCKEDEYRKLVGSIDLARLISAKTGLPVREFQIQRAYTR